MTLVVPIARPDILLVRTLSRRAIEPGVHGTSFSTRTSGGRLNLGLAQPYVRYSVSYRQQSGKLNRHSHSLTSLILAFPFSFSLSLFLFLFPSLPPRATYVQEREEKEGRGERGGGNEKCTYTRPAVRPAGRFTRKAKVRQSRAGRRQSSPVLKRVPTIHTVTHSPSSDPRPA